MRRRFRVPPSLAELRRTSRSLQRRASHIENEPRPPPGELTEAAFYIAPRLEIAMRCGSSFLRLSLKGEGQGGDQATKRLPPVCLATTLPLLRERRDKSSHITSRSRGAVRCKTRPPSAPLAEAADVFGWLLASGRWAGVQLGGNCRGSALSLINLANLTASDLRL